ncbi:FAD:protein FMN transferase [uncultured Alistipes sp.]|uniref:FAD:protein FMN transferase n=1 Tax=uncultured Alistipes sp. TaxID=538949 RepID=UPI0026309BC6|nr:FAD:protein FMN transferase [uncultured Alistipes sp.]
MKNRTLLLLLAALAALCPSCRREPDYRIVEGVMLGTTLRVTTCVGEPSAGELYRRIMGVDSAMKRSMSIFDEGSLLSRLNRNETDSVDEHIVRNWTLAREIGALSGGRYDVTVKPLVDAWGFAGRERTAAPNLDSLLEFVGSDKVSVRDGRLVKSDPRVQLDFNSVAKGYTVDRVALLLEEYGAENYLVDIGGEVRCRGVNPHGDPWRIGIERPVDGVAYGQTSEVRVALSGGSLATSGNYRRFFIDAAGNKVAHTIDPRTGRSVVSRLLSATVVADDCARADALATMFMALGAEEALRWVAVHPEAKVLFILADGGEGFETYVSPAMRNLILE